MQGDITQPDIDILAQNQIPELGAKHCVWLSIFTKYKGKNMVMDEEV